MNAVWDGLVGALIASAITGVVTWILFRRQSAVQQHQFEAQVERWRRQDSDRVRTEVAEKERRESERKETEKNKVITNTTALLQDVGTLIHHCSRKDPVPARRHIISMEERLRRGEYNVSALPSYVQSEFQCFRSVVNNYEILSQAGAFQGTGEAEVLYGSIQEIARLVQSSLERIRA